MRNATEMILYKISIYHIIIHPLHVLTALPGAVIIIHPIHVLTALPGRAVITIHPIHVLTSLPGAVK